MKFKTVYDGEKAILIDRNGAMELIEGPKRVLLVMSKLEKLIRYVAETNEYLVIKYLNGMEENSKGPTVEWFNRFMHESIGVRKGITLDQSQMIVVYNRDNESKEVQRKLVKGPCLYILEANEWIHEFKWHVQDLQNIGHMKLSEAASFTVLTLKPDFFHYYINEVRSLDDSLITVKLMVIYEMQDVELMLNKTQDPISDFINAICADVVSLVSKMTFIQFLSESSKKLNNLDSYEQLKQRSERNGFKIISVNYTGYLSSNVLQQMQDNAIQSRTEMRLNAEVDKQNNELVNLQLAGQNKRFDLENSLNVLKNEYDEKSRTLTAKHKLDTNELSHKFNLNVKELNMKSENEIELKKLTIDEEHLRNLKNLGVDIDKYQSELNKSANKLDTLYELVNY